MASTFNQQMENTKADSPRMNWRMVWGGFLYGIRNRSNRVASPPEREGRWKGVSTLHTASRATPHHFSIRLTANNE